ITDITPSQGVTSYLTIRRNPHDGSDSRLYQPLVKTRSRSIAVNQNLKKKLETYILNYRSAIPHAELTDFLILSNKGKPLSIKALDKIFSEISKVVLFNVHAHAFRHTWNDKFSEKSQLLVATGQTTEAQVENDRAYLMGWIPNSQSARRYSRRAENKRAVEVGLSIQEKFEDENE
ncbi:site-specific integrase, partial [Acinetobacter baumannii]